MKAKKLMIDIILLGIIAVLIFFMCWTSNMFAYLDLDLGKLVYGLNAGSAQIVNQGEIPFWYPYTWGGLSGAHSYFQTYDIIAVILYFVFFDSDLGMLSWSWISGYMMIHYFIFATGIFFLLQKKISQWQSFFVSSLVVFSNITFNMWQMVSIFAAVSYIPLILLFIDKAYDSEKRDGYKWCIICSLLMALGVLSNLSFGTVMILISYGLFFLVKVAYNKNNWKHILRMALVSGFFCIGWSVFGLLDFVNFTNHSIRQVDSKLLIGTERLTYEEFVAHPISSDTLSGFFNGNVLNVTGLSVCTIVIFLCVMGVFAKNKHFYTKYAITQFVVIIAYICSCLLPQVVYYLPVFNQVREQYLYCYLLSWPIAIIASQGLEALILEVKCIYEKNKSDIFYAKPIMILVMSIIALCQIISPNNMRRYNIVLIGMGVIWIGICIIRKYNVKKFAFLLAIGIVLINFIYMKDILLNQGMNTHQASQKVEVVNSNLIENIEKLEEISEKEEGWQFIGWGIDGTAYPANALVALGYKEEIPYLNPSLRKVRLLHDSLDLIKRFAIQNIKYILVDPTEANQSIIEMFENSQYDGEKTNIKYEGEFSIYDSYGATETSDKVVFENTFRNGVAWFVEDIITYSDAMSVEDVVGIMNSEDFNPLTMGLVNEKFLENKNIDLLKGDSSNTIAEVIEYKANTIKINTRSEDTRLMVTSEVFYPGWNVYIDGEKASLIEVNYAYKGVIVPGGAHEIELVYHPPLWKISMIIWGLTCCGAVIILFRKRAKYEK